MRREDLEKRIEALEAIQPEDYGPELSLDEVKRRLRLSFDVLRWVVTSAGLDADRFLWPCYGELESELWHLTRPGRDGGGWEDDPNIVPGPVVLAYFAHPQAGESMFPAINCGRVETRPDSLRAPMPAPDWSLIARVIQCRAELLTRHGLIDENGLPPGGVCGRWEDKFSADTEGETMGTFLLDLMRLRLDSHPVGLPDFSGSIDLYRKWRVGMPSTQHA